MPTVPRPGDFGIIYAASGLFPLPTYVDIKGVTQSYIEIDTSPAEMVTEGTGGVDTSKPYADATMALTLSLEVGAGSVTEYTVKLQFRRFDEASNPNAWKDLQTVLQNDPATIAAAQTIAVTGSVQYLALQTASVFTSGQIRILAWASQGTPSAEGDSLVIRGLAA